MAQRTVHYALGQRLLDQLGPEAAPRFLLGSLLPDAIRSKADRDASHYIVRCSDGARYYDFNCFRRDFAASMDDPLCLGYYMHLVEDCFYRVFIHREYHYYFVREENVRALHRDYHLLNPWLVEKYRLDNRLTLPADFDAEPLSRIARFDVPGLLRDFAADLSERPEGEYTYLSPPMMDEFIARCLPEAAKELRTVLRGESRLRPADFAWSRNEE